MAVDLFHIQSNDHLTRIFHNNNHTFDFSVSAFTRTGHARFRRAPPPSDLHAPPVDPHAPSVSSQSEKLKTVTDATASFQSSSDLHAPSVSSKSEEFPAPEKLKTVTNATASFQSVSSVVNAEGSVSNGKQLSSLGIVAETLSFSSRKPPLPAAHRRRHGGGGSVSRSGCHCCKRRKSGGKREVRKIPVIGSKVESIPADDYSWKKYGEKKVDGSRFPRVYYKCNTVKGCPARKRVELALTDSKMLIVTYDREHRHTPAPTPTPLPSSFNGFHVHSS